MPQSMQHAGDTIHSFTHLFIQKIWSPHHMSSMVQGIGYAVISKPDKNVCPCGAYTPVCVWGEMNNKPERDK